MKKSKPQQGKSSSHKSPSQQIDARIKELGDWRGAMLGRLRALVKEADPDVVATADALMLRAQIEEKRGVMKEAITSYRMVLKHEPDADDALAALVRIALKADLKDDALEYLRRYTLAVGADAAGLAQAAEWHLKLGRFEDAFDLASRSRDQNFNEKAQRVLGLVYLQREDFVKALAHLEKAALEAEVLEGSIRADLALGRLDNAIEQADKFDKIDEPTVDLQLACVAVKALAARREAILKAARPPEGQEAAWRRAAGAFVCAEHAANLGAQLPRVETMLEAAFADGARLGPAFGFRSLAALEKGRLTKACADADQAIALSPDDARGYYVRGRIALERGSDKALSDLERAAKLSERKDAAVLHWLARALAQDGRKDEAIKTQREAVKLKPRDAEMSEQLQELEKDVKSGR